jgi:hypothetical protein
MSLLETAARRRATMIRSNLTISYGNRPVGQRSDHPRDHRDFGAPLAGLVHAFDLKHGSVAISFDTQRAPTGG